jgi:hypothetical protein
MKTNEIKVGHKYRAKVSGNLTTVYVNGLEPARFSRVTNRHGPTRFDVTNLRTNRRTTMTAAKMRREVSDEEFNIEERRRIARDVAPMARNNGIAEMGGRPVVDPQPPQVNTDRPAMMEQALDRYQVKLYGVVVWSGKVKITAEMLTGDLNTAIKRHEEETRQGL